MPIVEVPTPVIPAEPPWPGTLAAVLAAADAGRFAAADSILHAFGQSEAGTPEAGEAAFWRVLLRADPRNPEFTPADARAALDAYLGSQPGPMRRTEAAVLLGFLATADSLRAAQTNFRAAAESRDRARDEELQKVRDELQRTQAELDRIKRRLASPKP
jgi:hypothetical protein